MSVKTDLIAARALIDTPRKFELQGAGAFTAVAHALLQTVAGHPDRYQAMRLALLAKVPPNTTLVHLSEQPLPNVLTVFDRAIEASE
jgi:hypothetical protein